MQTETPLPATPPRTIRIAAIDMARGMALVAMAIYHGAWDLEFFGYVPAGMTAVGGWKIFARCIASSFLFLVGFSLFLAHGEGIRWPGFRKRLAMVAGAAAAISAVTYYAVPDGFIFFGILHHIALASLLGLAFLRLPLLLVAAIAAGAVAAPFFLRSTLFEHPALWWVGLSPANPRSNDYVPLVPWFAAVLAGIVAARISAALGVPERMARLRADGGRRPLAFIGRHSLAFYLLHQPVLIALVWLAAQIVPPTPEPREPRFVRACEASCGDIRDKAFCVRYCSCMLEELAAGQALDGVLSGDGSEDQRLKVEGIAGFCTAATEAMPGEAGQ